MTTDLIRIFVAFPIARSDAGKLVVDHDATTSHETAEDACLAAESMALQPYYCGGVALTGVVDLSAGECSHSEVIMSFGEATAHEQRAR